MKRSNKVVFCTVITTFIYITLDVWCNTLKLGCPSYKEHACTVNTAWYKNEDTSKKINDFLPGAKLANGLQDVIKLDRVVFILFHLAKIKVEFIV